MFNRCESVFSAKYISFKNIFFIICVALVLLICSLTAANSSTEELLQNKPTGFFHPVFLGDENMRTYTYAPWGNVNEENATLKKFRIGSGGFYSKIAYYGDSPLELWEGAEGEGEKKISKILYYFDRIDRTREEILLILPSHNGSTKVLPLDFSTEKVPFGSIFMHSFSNEPIYISLADKKFKLDSGKNFLIEPDKFSSKHLLLLAFLKRNGSYKQVLKQPIKKFATKRNYVLMKATGDSIKPLYFYESTTYQNTITGLDALPHLILQPTPKGVSDLKEPPLISKPDRSLGI
jgi:hypothetical protein